MRYKLTIEYDGGPYVGWQRLAGSQTVQGALEDAVEKLTGARPEVMGAGRTDSGVHALGQVAHVDLEKHFAPSRLCDALNAHLRPHPISVLSAEEVSDEFHARFSAKRRVYLYTILNRRAPPAIARGKVWRLSRRLDVDAMHAAAQRLIGKHDFTTFRDANCQAKSPVKTLDRCDVTRDGENLHIWCEAQSFLHRQVRSIVGTLVEVGDAKMSADDVAAALAAVDRTRCGPVAPPDGLFLMRVDY
ncbi:MAG: tRNA pseudouridine(38-40) synthase TruA [Alphaproteobacteria bacterium]|nr:MAG: tRNA pseudouridine(38-40) synthase TruA [Alphaproteobacteria bacterium]